MNQRERLMGARGHSRAMARKAPRNRAPRVSPGVRSILRKLEARPGPEGPKAFWRWVILRAARRAARDR